MDINENFSFLNLEIKRDFVLNYGEYISEIDYYGSKVLLYIIEGYYIEMFYNTVTEQIDQVEILDPKEKRLNLYVYNVNISDALRF